jgi:hypothetical protein
MFYPMVGVFDLEFIYRFRFYREPGLDVLGGSCANHSDKVMLQANIEMRHAARVRMR